VSDQPTPPAQPSNPGPSGGELNADELAAWRGLLRVHARVTRALDDELVATHSLPLTSYEVLLTLDNAGGRLRMAELADSMLLSRSGHARLVDRLEHGGLARSDAAELADSVLLSRSGLTRVVDRLEQRGLVDRETLPSEQPGSHAVLTESGRTALVEARKTHLAGVRRRVLGCLSVEEQRAMGGIFDRILERNDDEEGIS
jgi:DNA-binding MarR family transcriptional regulator